MKYWIKQRWNPQLGTYYAPMGPMPANEARKYEKSIYGSNVMLSFKSKKEYLSELLQLRRDGKEVQP